MKSIIIHFFILQAIIIVVNTSIPEQYICRKEAGTYQPDSPYKTNIKSALKKLLDGYKSAITGTPGDQVSAVGICAGYLKPSDCKTCMNIITNRIQKHCPNEKSAVAFKDMCMIRYGTEVGDDIWFDEHFFSPSKANNVQGLIEALRKLLANMLIDFPSFSETNKSYAFGNVTYGSPNQNLYMYIQCTPDTIPDDQCRKCIVDMIEQGKFCCTGSMEATVFTPICYLKFAHHLGEYWSDQNHHDMSPVISRR